MAANAITENTNTPLSVFITGATSALGREVTRQLTHAGHRVTGATTGYENAALVRADGGFPAYPDLMRAGEIKSILLSSKADVVIHLAPQAANHLPQQRAHWDARLVDEGVSILLDAAQAAGVKFVIHTSYAFADAESEALDGLLHAVKAGEQKVLKSAVPGCVLRMGFVYGAESPELIATRDTLMMGRPVDCGPDNSHAQWINVPDAARAVVLAALQCPAGALLTVVEDQAVSPAEFLSYFADSLGVSRPGRAPQFALWAQPKPEQVALMSLSPHVSSADTKEKLGWSPRFATYQAGIDDVLLSWRTTAPVETT
ncbi:MAG: NAD-dependent epimerase/dehydratase family protein [Chloroflexi bacterium]|nr:NAD-dependent epimerase/dehydratase family protein [Chloroflexota bacterium]